MATQSQSWVASARPSALLMALGYALGAVGIALGSNRLPDGPAAIAPVALWSVGLLGVVSFVRHAVFHRSDAKRMKWDTGQTNSFQIEVGMANLAWGLVALAAVIWQWGPAVQAAVTAVFGVYLVLAATLHLRVLVVGPASQRRGALPAVATIAMGALLLFFAVVALTAAPTQPG